MSNSDYYIPGQIERLLFAGNKTGKNDKYADIFSLPTKTDKVGRDITRSIPAVKKRIRSLENDTTERDEVKKKKVRSGDIESGKVLKREGPLGSEKVEKRVKIKKEYKSLEPVSNAERRIMMGNRRDQKVEENLKNRRTAFVGNVALSTTKKDLLNLFKTCGKIESIRLRSAPVASLKLPKKALVIRKEFHPNRSNLNAYVVFMDPVSVEEALKLNNTELNGLHIRVDLAKSSKLHSHKNSVFVGNLPFNASEEKLRLFFGECGQIENIRLIRDRITGVGKGFGYVLFKDVMSVDLALNLDEQEFEKRKLRVQKSSPNRLGESKFKENKKKLSGQSKKFVPSELKNKSKKKKTKRELPANITHVSGARDRKRRDATVPTLGGVEVEKTREEKAKKKKKIKKLSQQKRKEKMKSRLGEILAKLK